MGLVFHCALTVTIGTCRAERMYVMAIQAFVLLSCVTIWLYAEDSCNDRHCGTIFRIKFYDYIKQNDILHKYWANNPES